MSGVLMVALVVGGVVVYGVVSTAQRRIAHHGWLVIVWRFVSGNPWHGSPLSDAGWMRPASRAMTPSGHVGRFWTRPRIHRAGIRLGTALFGTVAVIWLLRDWRSFAWVWGAATVVAAGAGALVAIRRRKSRSSRRKTVKPAHNAIAPLVGKPASASTSYLRMDRARTAATVALPQTWRGGPAERRQLEELAASRLGIPDAEASWRLGGPKPQLSITRGAPIPDRVDLADVQPHLERLRSDELLIGLGRGGKPVTVSLADDSPHLGLSMGTGSGKSTLARLLAGQILARGGLVVILDPKRTSHPWGVDMPNVATFKDAEAIHSALLLLRQELDYRNHTADQQIDIEGVQHGNAGPRLLVIIEEINLAQKALRRLWQSEMRGPGEPSRSPALDAMDDVLFAGRSVGMHCAVIGQRLSAAALGGADGRENLSARILGRWTPGTWKMLGHDGSPMPAPSNRPGRVAVVGSSVRLAQVPIMSGHQTREMGLGGAVSELPARWRRAGVTAPQSQVTVDANPPADQGVVTGASLLLPQGEHAESVPSTPAGVTLAEAVDRDLVAGKSLSSLRSARHRDKRFPTPVDWRGTAALYDVDALARWAASTG